MRRLSPDKRVEYGHKGPDYVVGLATDSLGASISGLSQTVKDQMAGASVS